MRCSLPWLGAAVVTSVSFPGTHPLAVVGSYNSVGTIDGNAINKLNLVVNLTRHIHVKAMVRDEEDSGMEFSE
jgi:hypothetical protein